MWIALFRSPTWKLGVLALSIGLASAAYGSEQADEAGFVSLFNGEDLRGWMPVGNPEAFVIKDKCLLVTGAKPYPTWLRTDREYENFVLRFDYRMDGWSEAGFFIHAPKDGPPITLGKKVHLFYSQSKQKLRTVGAIYDVAAPLAEPNNPKGEWNQVEIHCDWPTLRVHLNGVLIHDIDMARHPELKYRLRRGYLGIENVGCEVLYRNLRIRELEAKEEWTHLFTNGMDGLRPYEGTLWNYEDDVITGYGGHNGYAITKEVFESPIELQVWVKTQTNGNGGVFYRWNVDPEGNGARGPEIQVYNVTGSTNPTGSIYGISHAPQVITRDNEWFLLQILADGPWTQIRVNGVKMAESNSMPPPYSGNITFQQHTSNGMIHYRGARIKRLENHE